jgi:uncharacterized protein (DUF342 family)
VVIDLDTAKPGMVLLEDVLLPNGSILINASQTLSQPLIETLKKRGIRKIQIVSEQDAQQMKKEAAQLAELTVKKEAESAPAAEKEAPPTLPTLRLVMREDLMSAKLCIEPTDSPNQVLTRDAVMKVLFDNDIEFGMNDAAVNAAVEKWKKFKRYYEIEDVAKGTLPMPGHEGGFEFRVKYLTNVSEIETVKHARYVSDLPKELAVQRIDQGVIIAKRQQDTPPIPGRNIKGGLVPTTDMVKVEMGCDNNVRFTDDRRQIVSQVTGFAYFLDGKLAGAVPFNFDGGIEVAVSADKMKTELVVHAPGQGGKAPAKTDINALLNEKKIFFGVKNDVLDKLAADISRGFYPPEPVVAAEGLAPKNGDNGAVKFLFNTESSLKPKMNQDGSVDYKNVDIVTSAGKGQELATLIAPTKGTPGRNVFGQEIPATDGTAAKLPMGPNTMVSPTKPNVLVAGTDGNVRFNGSNIEVSEGFVVKGNVDFSTGNIKYPKSIVVSGDVKSGFKIECGGDLQVSGTIEDSELVVNGNVLCKLGFIGQGKGLINAKGDVNITFMKNQTVKSRQNITIAKEAINATLFARKSVTVHGNPLSIAGGRVMARDSVNAHTIGNMSGVKTLIEVGTDFTLIEELEKTEAQITELMENRKKLMATFQKYDQAKNSNMRMGAKEEFLLAKLKATLAKYDQQVKTLEERKNIINSKMHNFKSAFIKIEHSAKSGTMFKIGLRHFVVKDEVIGPKSVRLINEEIRII